MENVRQRVTERNGDSEADNGIGYSGWMMEKFHSYIRDSKIMEFRDDNMVTIWYFFDVPIFEPLEAK